MSNYNPTGKILIFILLVTLFFAPATGQNYQDPILYKAFIDGNLSVWKTRIDQLETRNLKTESEKLDLINCYYGYTGWLIEMEKSKLADKYIEKSYKLLDDIVKQHPKQSTALAYRGAFIGLEIGLHPYKAMFLGPKSIEYIDLALKIAPNNMQANMEKGNSLYYTPSMFGGSKQGAIDAYLKAVNIIEETNTTENNWMYLNALTVLAQAYQKNDQMEKARKVYKKILDQEPDYIRVKTDLYPAFQNEMMHAND